MLWSPHALWNISILHPPSSAKNLKDQDFMHFKKKGEGKGSYRYCTFSPVHLQVYKGFLTYLEKCITEKQKCTPRPKHSHPPPPTPTTIIRKSRAFIKPSTLCPTLFILVESVFSFILVKSVLFHPLLTVQSILNYCSHIILINSLQSNTLKGSEHLTRK